MATSFEGAVDKISQKQEKSQNPVAAAIAAAMTMKKQQDETVRMNEQSEKSRDMIKDCVIKALQDNGWYKEDSFAQQNYIRGFIQEIDESFFEEIKTQEDSENLRMFIRYLFESDTYTGHNPRNTGYQYFTDPERLGNFNIFHLNDYLKDFQYFKTMNSNDQPATAGILKKFFLLRHISRNVSLKRVDQYLQKNNDIEMLDLVDICFDENLRTAFKNTLDEQIKAQQQINS